MPRVIVATVPVNVAQPPAVLLDEHVDPVRLSTEHCASQLIERIARARGYAQRAQSARSAPPSAG